MSRWPYHPMLGISIDPDYGFGGARVERVGIPVRALAYRAGAGDSISYLAWCFEVSARDVLAAVRYMRGRQLRHRKHWRLAEEMAARESLRRWQQRARD